LFIKEVFDFIRYEFSMSSVSNTVVMYNIFDCSSRNLEASAADQIFSLRRFRLM